MFKSFKKSAGLVMAAILALTVVAPYSALAENKSVKAKATFNDIQVVMDGKPVTLTNLDGTPQEPILVFDTLYAPLSALARAFGKTSQWDNAAKQITLKSGAQTSVLNKATQGTSATKETTVYFYDIKVYLDGKLLPLTDLSGNPQEPVIIFDTAYVPLSALARALGGDSVYDGKNHTVHVKRPVTATQTAPSVNAPPAGETAEGFNLDDLDLDDLDDLDAEALGAFLSTVPSYKYNPYIPDFGYVAGVKPVTEQYSASRGIFTCDYSLSAIEASGTDLLSILVVYDLCLYVKGWYYDGYTMKGDVGIFYYANDEDDDLVVMKVTEDTISIIGDVYK